MVKKITTKEEVLDTVEGVVETTPEVVEETKEEVKESKVSSVSVMTKDGQVLRTYTKEIHGKDFALLAKEYADKKGLSLK